MERDNLGSTTVKATKNVASELGFNFKLCGNRPTRLNVMH